MADVDREDAFRAPAPRGLQLPQIMDRAPAGANRWAAPHRLLMIRQVQGHHPQAPDEGHPVMHLFLHNRGNQGGGVKINAHSRSPPADRIASGALNFGPPVETTNRQRRDAADWG
jgi:hypothetical protein